MFKKYKVQPMEAADHKTPNTKNDGNHTWLHTTENIETE